jgi:hypothetical protein
VRIVFGLILLIAMAGPVLAETAIERASEIKTWRDQCSDPDADLRIAYIEAAIASKDMAIMRVCVRQSLESDNADIRNLGLRAAIASVDQLRFDADMPASLAAALKKAGNDDDALRDVGRLYVAQMWSYLETGLVFSITDADITSGTSTWWPLAQLDSPSDNFKGKATVVGDQVTWVGSARLVLTDCRLNLDLVAGPMLQGTFQCGRADPFTVRARLL